MIEQAENFLRDLGFFDVRVRHHELPIADCPLPIDRGTRASGEAASPSAIGNPQSAIRRSLARIEVGPSEMGRLLVDEVAARVAAELRRIGYAHVTLDLQGYRRGSLNETGAA
jgi:uncharacterized protein